MVTEVTEISRLFADFAVDGHPPSEIGLTGGGRGGIDAGNPMSATHSTFCSKWSDAGAMAGCYLRRIGVDPRLHRSR